MHFTSRIVALALAIALLGAQSLPCATAPADAQQHAASDAAQTIFKARGHLDHAHGAMAHLDSETDHAAPHDEHPSLRAYCSCGCSGGATKSNIPAYRLGFSLLTATLKMDLPHETQEPAGSAAPQLPSAPVFALERVPLFA